MSTRPGNGEDRPVAGPNSGGSAPPDAPDQSGQSGRSRKTVAASAAKPGRDETTVELTSADETKADLPKIDPDADPPAADPAGASEPSQAPGAAGSTPGAGAGAASGIGPVKDTPGGEPGSSAEGPSWTRPPQPATSVSNERAEGMGLPVPGGASTASGPDAHTSGSAGHGSNNSGPGIQPPMNATPAGPDPAGQDPGSRGTPGPGEPSGPAMTPPPGQPSGRSSRFGTGGIAGTLLKNRAAKAPSAAGTGTGPAGGRTARKAQLQLARLEPWSVMKFSFVMSLVCFVVLLVAVTVLYAIMSWLGVFSAITDTVSDLTRGQGETTGGVDAGSWFSFARVFGYTVLVGALNVLLITALSTVGSVIYNLAADLVGGVEVTLKEAE